MKMRKFADEGIVREGSNENIGDDTRARARKFVDDGNSSNRVFADPDKFSGPAAKPAIVTKEELAKSGMSLRDYMNAQQGRTRRGASAAPVDTPVERGLPAMSAKERSVAISQIPLDDERKPIKGESVSGSEFGRNVKNTLNAMAGFKGVQLGQAAVEGLATPRAITAAKGLMGGKQAAEVRRIEPTMSTASAAKKAELAGELRRGATPTNFTSPSKTASAKRTRKINDDEVGVEFRKGGYAKGYASGGAVSASRRGDGIAQRGKTRGKMC